MLARAVFQSASFFNNSCAPNCYRLPALQIKKQKLWLKISTFIELCAFFKSFHWVYKNSQTGRLVHLPLPSLVGKAIFDSKFYVLQNWQRREGILIVGKPFFEIPFRNGKGLLGDWNLEIIGKDLIYGHTVVGPIEFWNQDLLLFPNKQIMYYQLGMFISLKVVRSLLAMASVFH